MDNARFVIAGYGITWVVLAWYALRLERRVRGAEAALDGRPGAES
ncbi:MAG: CcmD family protein [Gemmatimonadota bacterium]